MNRMLPVALLCAWPLAASADVLIHHHGRLLDSEDKPVDADQAFTFALYPGEAATTSVWEETYELKVRNGLYSVALGDTRGDKKSLDATVFEGQRWLAISVGPVELSPRLLVGSMPFAARAALADRALDADSLGGRDAAEYALEADVDSALETLEATLGAELEALGEAVETLDKTAAKVAGAAFTGPVVVPAPTSDAHATTKKYVDEAIAAVRPEGFAQLAGADFTGPVSVPAPTAEAHATTKGYVDASLVAALATAGVDLGATRPASPADGRLFFNTASGSLEVYDGNAWRAFGGTYPSCKAILDAGASTGDGIYTIRPDPSMPAFPTFCDMTTAGGGWTLVASVSDQNHKRTADHPDQRWNRAGYNAWADESTFGALETATKSYSGDYKNPAYFKLTAENVLVYHTPNDTGVTGYRSAAIYAYHTEDGFLAGKGGNLHRLYKDHHPLASGDGNTDGVVVPVTFTVGTAADLHSEQNPSNRASSSGGSMTFLRRNQEKVPFAWCPVKWTGSNSEHGCIGGNGTTTGAGSGGWGNFREWQYDAQWGFSARMRAAAVMFLVR